VVQACAEPAPGRSDTWINQEILRLSLQLYDMGFAHSVECWRQDQLVGGLYGVAIGGLFAAESMFHHAPDASKVALAALVDHLGARGFVLLDVQLLTPHLASLGAIEIPRDEYLARLADALARGSRWS
jgi:leucyl/phenylalanyl-tRNA--protein transferase